MVVHTTFYQLFGQLIRSSLLCKNAIPFLNVLISGVQKMYQSVFRPTQQCVFYFKPYSFWAWPNPTNLQINLNAAQIYFCHVTNSWPFPFFFVWALYNQMEMRWHVCAICNFRWWMQQRKCSNHQVMMQSLFSVVFYASNCTFEHKAMLQQTTETTYVCLYIICFDVIWTTNQLREPGRILYSVICVLAINH